MRFVLVLILISAVLLGLGLYRGWFHISSESAVGKSDVTVTVDKNRIEEDKNKVVGSAAAAIEKAKEPSTQPALGR